MHTNTMHTNFFECKNKINLDTMARLLHASRPHLPTDGADLG